MTTDGGPRSAGKRRRPALPEPFRISVHPLGDAPWLRFDDELEGLRAARRAHHARAPHEVHRRDPCTAARSDVDVAAAETLSLVRGELRRAAREPPVSSDAPDLVCAALAIAEDLVVLVRAADGWRLVEAFVAAPSAWRLDEKIGRPLGAVHAPVPGFAAGTRSDATIERMFDALRPDAPVVRRSWSLHADAQRFVPRHAPDHAERPGRGAADRRRAVRAASALGAAGAAAIASKLGGAVLHRYHAATGIDP